MPCNRIANSVSQALCLISVWFEIIIVCVGDWLNYFVTFKRFIILFIFVMIAFTFVCSLHMSKMVSHLQNRN